MMLRILIPLSLAFGSAAHAANVSLTVKGTNGKPVAEAVVVIESPATPPGPIRFPWAYEMAQQDIMFTPHVLIVPVNATVRFPNRDKVRHHVYSASTAKKFDLKLYGREEARSLVFDRPGAVVLGCNIHDAMSGVVYVTASPYTMKTDSDGRVAIPNVPAGAATIRVWHPSIRAPGNTATQPITISESGFSTTLTLPSR